MYSTHNISINLARMYTHDLARTDKHMQSQLELARKSSFSYFREERFFRKMNFRFCTNLAFWIVDGLYDFAHGKSKYQTFFHASCFPHAYTLLKRK